MTRNWNTPLSHTVIVSNTKPLRYKYNNSVYNIFASGNQIPNPIPRPEGGIKIHASRQRSKKSGHTPQEPTCSIHEYHMFRPSLLRHYMLMITPLHTPRLFSPQTSTVEPRYEEVEHNKTLSQQGHPACPSLLYFSVFYHDTT